MHFISTELTALGGTSGDNCGVLGHLLWRSHASRENIAVQGLRAQGFTMHNTISASP